MMKSLLIISALLLSVFLSPAHAGCAYPKGGVPNVPDPETATDRAMMEARLKVEQYIAQATDFIQCARPRGDKRVDSIVRRAARLANRYSEAHQVYTARVAKTTQSENKLHGR